MSFVQTGSCPKCGAPVYVESPWFAVTPPPVRHSCGCHPRPKIYTASNTGTKRDAED